MNATVVLAPQYPDLACAVGSIGAAGEVDILNCDEFCQAVKELLKANTYSDSLVNSSGPQMKPSLSSLSVDQDLKDDFKSHKMLTHCSALEPEQILALSSELSSLDLLPMMAASAEKQAEEIKKQVLQC